MIWEHVDVVRVLVNGKPKLSCLVLAQEVQSCEITTVEGLADGHHLHPIQEMFSEYGGSQCGFCTPGFLVVISSLLDENPTPNESEIKNAIEEIYADVLVINKLLILLKQRVNY